MIKHLRSVNGYTGAQEGRKRLIFCGDNSDGKPQLVILNYAFRK